MAEFTLNTEFYDVKQFARLTHYTERRIREFCNNGTIKAFRLGSGHKLLIPHSELGRFIKSGTGQKHLLKLLKGEVLVITGSKKETELTEQEIITWLSKAKKGDKLTILDKSFSSISPISRVKKELKKL